MASTIPPIRCSGLVAVALIIRSRDGPRFVFHYPPRPSTEASQGERLYGTELDESESKDSSLDETGSDESDLEDGGYSLPRPKHLDKEDKPKQKNHVAELNLEGDDHYDKPNGEHVVPWEHLFEFDTTDLESILTPSRAYHKKKFEMSLDPLIFVTYPIHIREDGLWKKKKPKKAKKSSKIEGSEAGAGSGETKFIEEEMKDVILDPKRGDASEDGDDHGGMTMFNIVFILNPRKDQAREKIKDIYEHVIKKFNKALKHAQASANYVWKESEMMLLMKEKAKEERRPMSWLWNEILIKSTLAAAIRDVYHAISVDKIATVRFATKPPLDLSLQVPIPNFLMSLPTSTEKAMPGLLVTTANPLINEEGNEDPTHLNKHFALLLLDNESKIVAEIQADDTDLSEPLIECIRLCKPTLSFLQVAQTNAVDVSSLLILAQHLIYWRRAIAIPPLHAREMYIVSPNCDSRKLPAASVAWKKAFPLAPSLPSFLAALSAAPRPFKTFAPSKDHRPTYLDMIAWLIRGGWVTQLRTFAWILVWPEIIYEVQYQLKSEAIEKSKKGNKSRSGSSESTESTDESSAEKHSHTDPSVPLTTEQVAENARLERLADKLAKEAAEAAADFAKMPRPVATEHPSINNSEHLNDIPPYIIKDPHKVSHEESLYIAALAKRFTEPKSKECWTKFTKYFNGCEALEMIALQENRKRKETWGILMSYHEHLLVCKHW
ncbi:Nitrogen Permease regulator of amino acid transport activity 3 domain containing protein [Hyaloscypha variabilis]